MLVRWGVSDQQQICCHNDLYIAEPLLEVKQVMMYTKPVLPPVCVCLCVWACISVSLREKKALDRSSCVIAVCLPVFSLPGRSLLHHSHELQDCGDVHGDRQLCGLRERMDPGLFHHAHRDLDLVWSGQHCLDHLKLLLQFMEGLYLWFHWSVWL